MHSIGTRRFQIEEHPTSLDQKFCIMDEDDKCLYTVKAPLFTVGDKLTLLDGYGNELFKIRQQLKHIHLTFHIYNTAQNHDDDDDGKSKLATVKQVGSPFKHTLEIQSVYGDYLMKRNGGMTCSEYTLSKNGSIVAEVKRKFPALAARYTVDIDEHVKESEIPFVLALVITLWCAHRYRGGH
jgi:uncharacterized protein YxjI